MDSGPLTPHQDTDQDNEPCLFFKLPRELRDMIYEYATPVEAFAIGPDYMVGKMAWLRRFKVSSAAHD